MSQEVLDHLRVHAATEQQRGASVAEVVPAYVWQASVAEQGLEVAVDEVLSVNRRVDGGDER